MLLVGVAQCPTRAAHFFLLFNDVIMKQNDNITPPNNAGRVIALVIAALLTLIMKTMAQAQNTQLETAYQLLIQINKNNTPEGVSIFVDDNTPTADWFAANKRLQEIARSKGLEFCLMQGYEVFVADYPNELAANYLHADGGLHRLCMMQDHFVVIGYPRRTSDLHPPTPNSAEDLEDFVQKHEESYWWIVHPQERFF